VGIPEGAPLGPIPAGATPVGIPEGVATLRPIPAGATPVGIPAGGTPLGSIPAGAPVGIPAGAVPVTIPGGAAPVEIPRGALAPAVSCCTLLWPDSLFPMSEDSLSLVPDEGREG